MDAFLESLFEPESNKTPRIWKGVILYVTVFQKDLFLEVVGSVNFMKPKKRWGFAILIHTWT